MEGVNVSGISVQSSDRSVIDDSSRQCDILGLSETSFM